jgi:hypothetical protein
MYKRNGHYENISQIEFLTASNFPKIATASVLSPIRHLRRPARDISMSLAYIGTWGRGEVAALVSFSIHMSKLHKRTKWPVWLKLFQVCGPRGGQIFASRKSETVRVIAGYWELTARKSTAERKRLCGTTHLKMAEGHWVTIQGNRGRPRTSDTDGNSVIVEGLIKEVRRG